MLKLKLWWRLSVQWLLLAPFRFWQSKQGTQSGLGAVGLFRGALLVALFGLSLGVGALVLTKALVAGFEKTLALGVRASQGDLVFYTRWRNLAEFRELLGSLGSAAVVKDEARSEFAPPWTRVEAFWSSQGLVVGPKTGKGILIEGQIDLTADKKNPPSALDSVNLASVSVKVGKPLASLLGVDTGKKLKLLLPGVLKGSVGAEVSELVSFGMYALDSRYLRLNSTDLEPWIRAQDPGAWDSRPGDAHALRFFLKEDYQGVRGLRALESLRSAWVPIFEKHFPDEKERGVLLQTWRESKGNLFGAIEHERGTLSLVMAVLVLVAAVNVATALIVLFMQRESEIAWIRAMGMNLNQFRGWVVFLGLLLGVSGGVLGLLLSRLMGLIFVHLPWAKLPPEIYNISQLPLHFRWQDDLIVFLFAVLSSVLVSVWVAWRLGQNSLKAVIGWRA